MLLAASQAPHHASRRCRFHFGSCADVSVHSTISGLRTMAFNSAMESLFAAFRAFFDIRFWGGIFLVLFLEFREHIGELGVQWIVGGYIVEVRYSRYILDRVFRSGFGGFQRMGSGRSVLVSQKPVRAREYCMPTERWATRTSFFCCFFFARRCSFLCADYTPAFPVDNKLTAIAQSRIVKGQRNWNCACSPGGRCVFQLCRL
ncbi:hypothetical protein KC356_g357 [Hortaea werneckii]|nr:hypothetical protein KC356_g357 [Hortaea werneckii]